MTNFDADILSELRDLREVAIRTEKHPNTAVVIWVAVRSQVAVREPAGEAPAEDSASVQAAARVNAEQASKMSMCRPTRRPFRGRRYGRPSVSKVSRASFDNLFHVGRVAHWTRSR